MAKFGLKASLTKYTTDQEWLKIRGNKIATVQDPMTSLNPVRTIGYQISRSYSKAPRQVKAEAKEIAIDLMERVGIPNAEKRYDEYPHVFRWYETKNSYSYSPSLQAKNISL